MKREGKPGPLDILPQISDVGQWYMDVFNLLCGFRIEDHPIPLAEILSYAENFPLIGSKIEFIKAINALDKIILKDHKDKFDKIMKEKKDG